jgi:O-succinylbenzoate synthase
MPTSRLTRYKLECRPYRRVFREPIVTAHDRWKIREGLIVRLEDQDGGVGYGEAAPVPGFSRETVMQMQTWAHNVKKHLNVTTLANIPARLPTLRGAVGCALGMLSGLFTKPRTIKPLAVATLLPAGPGARAALVQRAAEGYRIFKWKMATRSVAEELKILESLLKELPHGGRLRLDANGGLAARDFAKWTSYLQGLGTQAQAIEFVEQPFSATHPPSSWRSLAKKSAVPVALDEGVTGLPALRRLHTTGWSGPLVVKTSLLGDFENFLRWRARTRADLVYSSAFETSVGLHAALWLAATDIQPNRRALGFGTLDAFADDGLQLPIHASGPRLGFAPISIEEFSALWNRLPHLA